MMLIDEILGGEEGVPQSRVQTKDFKHVKLAIIPVQEATVMPLLYDVGEGRVFGQNTMVDVCLFDSDDRRQDLDTLAANMAVAAFPWLNSITVPKTVSRALKYSDYIVLNPRMLRNKLSLKYAMFDQAPFFVAMANKIDKFANHTAWVTVISPSYTSLFCHILATKMTSIPPTRITGLKLHIQVLATNVIADRLNVPPANVKGITVWGENIIDYQMATVDFVPHPREIFDDASLRLRFKTYWEYRIIRKGFLINECNLGAKLREYYNDGKDKNHDCTYCRGVALRKQRDAELEAKLDDSGNTNEKAQGQNEAAVADKCQAIKALQDNVMHKISQYLKSKSGRHGERIKLDEKELLEVYRKDCPMGDARKNNFQCNDDGAVTNILPVMEVIQDHHWLLKSLPKVCLQASGKPGGAVARCLSEHVHNLHFGVKKPFSVLATSDDAYNLPKGLFSSGPGVVDDGTGSVAFYPLYEMSVNTQLKLFHQIVKLKKQYLLLDRGFWEREAGAFDKKMMPLLEKNELGIAPSALKKSCPGKQSPSAFKQEFKNGPSKIVRDLQDVILWYRARSAKQSRKKRTKLKGIKPQRSTVGVGDSDEGSVDISKSDNNSIQ